MVSATVTSKISLQRKAILLFLLPLTVSLCVVGTGTAQALNLGQILQLLNQIVSEAFGVQLWDDTMSDPCSNSFPWDEQICSSNSKQVIDMKKIFEQSQGDLKIPNPNQTRQKAVEAANSKNDSGDVFEVNPTIYGTYAGNQTDRLNTRGAIETVLGEEGQKDMKKQLDDTQNIVKEVAADADAAQFLTTTQDVMKKMASIMSQQSVLTAAIRADALRSRIDTQYTNLNLINTSRSLDELTRKQRANDTANAMYLLEISGLARLN